MKTITRTLTARDLEEQKTSASMYFDLIQKELGYKDLCNIDNLNKYTEAYKKHCELLVAGEIKIQVPS